MRERENENNTLTPAVHERMRPWAEENVPPNGSADVCDCAVCNEHVRRRGRGRGRLEEGTDHASRRRGRQREQDAAALRGEREGRRRKEN